MLYAAVIAPVPLQSRFGAVSEQRLFFYCISPCVTVNDRKPENNSILLTNKQTAIKEIKQHPNDKD